MLLGWAIAEACVTAIGVVRPQGAREREAHWRQASDSARSYSGRPHPADQRRAWLRHQDNQVHRWKIDAVVQRTRGWVVVDGIERRVTNPPRNNGYRIEHRQECSVPTLDTNCYHRADHFGGKREHPRRVHEERTKEQSLRAIEHAPHE